MDFIYHYKTSDGVRHEGRMSADSNGEAFAALRKQGIRPIRVIADKSSCPKQISVKVRTLVCVISGMAFVALSSFACYLTLKSIQKSTRYRQVSIAAFSELEMKTKELERRHRDAMEQVDFKLLRNYGLLEQSQDMSPFERELAKAKSVVAWTRTEAKALFGNVMELFPASSVNERIDAQKLYSGLMRYADSSLARVESDEIVLVMLDENRDKWKMKDGEIFFLDDSFKEEIDFVKQDLDGGTLRWKQDFLPKERR